MNFHPLFSRDARGGIRVWKISTEGNAIITEHGQLDGQLQIDTRYAVGKNIGRANETSPDQQALSEAASDWKKKVDSGYRDNIDLLDGTELAALPMLAHKFSDKGQDFDWSAAFVQPKLDGTRCLARVGKDDVFLTSRNGKPIFTMKHIEEAIKALNLPEGTVLDGELFTTSLNFQEIVSAVKKVGPNTGKIEYHIYDLADPINKYEDRYKQLCSALPACASLVRVETHRVYSFEDVVIFHRKFTKQGYEGTMIRDGNSCYTLGQRSSGLLKLKDFLDGEFRVVAFTEGTGREAGCIIFVCETEGGKQFNVRPEGSQDARRAWLKDGGSFIGKRLTVRFQNLTNDGIPRFPVGVVVRDYE